MIFLFLFFVVPQFQAFQGNVLVECMIKLHSMAVARRSIFCLGDIFLILCHCSAFVQIPPLVLSEN